MLLQEVCLGSAAAHPLPVPDNSVRRSLTRTAPAPLVEEAEAAIKDLEEAAGDGEGAGEGAKAEAEQPEVAKPPADGDDKPAEAPSPAAPADPPAEG